jgi:hypothetical protein
MLDAFIASYIECALWSEYDDHDVPLDKNYGPEDIAPEALATMRADCKAFYEAHGDDLSHRDASQGGHDFWLTRNGHGAGFWDGDWPSDAGERLTDAARSAGETHLYVGDDGRLYIV